MPRLVRNEKATWDVVDATVDDNGPLLDPVSFHHLRFPDADNQYVRFAHLVTNERIAGELMDIS